MRNTFIAALTVALCALASRHASAQQLKPFARTADGKPDMTGTWQAGGVSINGEPGAPPLHPLPPAPIRPPARQRIPYQDWAAEKQKTFTVLDDPTSNCLLPGVPRIVGMPMPLEIVQTPKEVVILYESFRAWRRIPINEKLEHPNDLTPTWMGDSVGRWEGDTFVVDVTGFNDKTWFDRAGDFHSEALHVVERYTPVSPDVLEYEATIDDPTVFTRPWKIAFPLYRRLDKNAQFLEFKCVPFSEELVYGHLRKQEAK
jgi:hypothetical protein